MVDGSDLFRTSVWDYKMVCRLYALDGKMPPVPYPHALLVLLSDEFGSRKAAREALDNLEERAAWCKCGAAAGHPRIGPDCEAPAA